MGTGKIADTVKEKVKKKQHPVGRLGVHIKNGIGASFAAYVRDKERDAR